MSGYSSSKMRRLAVMGLLLGGLVWAGAPVGPFAPVLPGAVVDVTGWEIVSGEFETARARGAYLFYVNPRRQALYQLVRYQVELLAPASEAERVRRPAERVVFVREPGSHEPLLCWVREPLGSGPAWREVPPGTDEYRLEMGMVMRVLEVHRAARAQSAP